jgi:hypothetical protein
MPASTPSFLGPVKQIAYLTQDIDACMKSWIDTVGVGPWTCYQNVVLTGTYKGQQTEVRIHAALSYRDGVQIELIQLLSRTPSPYQDAAGTPLAGIHHLAWLSQDVAADTAAARERGLVPVFEASNPNTRVCYMEMPGQPGTLLELIQASPLVVEGFEQGVAASRDWDGKSNPVTYIDFAKF